MAPIPIAIVGTGCRFPGEASSPSRLWELLQQPREVASTPPVDRFNVDAFYQPGKPQPGTTNVRESYFLSEDIRAFDAPFFNISPVEAASMDPQQRLLMEVVYESLERAGLPLEQLYGSSTGIYCGCMNYEYSELLNTDPDVLPASALSGTVASMMAPRISYFFDWHGPSLVVDTACSASLTALHLAVDALQTGDCPLAIAAGSCLILSPDKYISASQMNMLSPTGRSQMWDVAANGYARGEGVAAVVLKRLDDAIRDGDHIESIIRATAINCDGRTKSLTIPNGVAQRELIQMAYTRAGLDPRNPKDRCQYFEAHGTGTQAGDPQEAEGIASALFDTGSGADEMLHVGSIKTVIGHSEGSAGIAGIIKASLALQHGVIPPNRLLQQLSPAVAPYASHLRVPTQALPWPDVRAGTPRRASVNSFSFGGANAHAILESFEGAREAAPEPRVVPAVLPFVFSAASEKSLQAVLRQFLDWLKDHSTDDLLDLAFTLMTRRSTLSHRIVLYADSGIELAEKLNSELALSAPTDGSATITGRSIRGQTRVLGVFTGQGAQWPQMGWDLIKACPQAAAWLQELQESLDTLPDKYRPSFTLLGELAAPDCSSRLHSASVSLPLRTALQILQVNILSTLGVTFAAVVGHSSGEIAAAYAAGWLSASDAIRIAYLRGVAVQSMVSQEQSGSMLAVGISFNEAQAICGEPPYNGRVAIAAVNSPSNVTFSGDSELISELEWLFDSLDYAPRRLRVDTAYHSHHMLPCSGPYLEAMIKCHVGGGGGGQSKTKWISSVYGGQVMTNLDPHYWSENMVRPVQFLEALTTALGVETDISLMVEVGPHAALRGPSLDTVSTIRPEKADMPYVSLAHRGVGGLESLALGVGAFWAYLGSQSIDIPAFVGLFESSRRLKYLPSLPTYPFDHSQRYWAMPHVSTARTTRRWPKHPLLGVPSAETGEGEWRWRNLLREENLPWADGHRVQSQILLPATAYLAMALEAVYLIAEGRVLHLVEICEVVIDRAIPIDHDSAGVETLFTLYETDSGPSNLSASFTCQLSVSGAYRRCASGRIEVTFGDQDANLLPPRDAISSGLRPVRAEQFYAELDKLGFNYAGLFRQLFAIQRRSDVAHGAIPVPDSDTDDFLVHPATLDTSLQVLLAAIGSPGDGQLSGLYLPTRLDRTTINPAFARTGAVYPPQGQLEVEAELRRLNVGGYTGDIHLFDASGRTFVQIEGMHVSQLQPLNDEDWPMFAETTWGPLVPNASVARALVSPFHQSSRAFTDRACLLCLRDIQGQLTIDDRQRLDGHRARYVAWMDRLLALVRDGTHPLYAIDSLAGDTASTLSLAAHQATPVEIQVLEITAHHLLDWLRGGASSMEAMRQDNLLTRLYQDNRDFSMMTHQLATMVGQLAFRYPRMKILEVGAGTGSATRMVLDQIGRDYHSYTFTDISAAFFEDAQEAFTAIHGDRIIYKVLDLELDPIEQGFAEQEYDLVICSNCLHATRRMKQTMTHIRRLLKPGGRLAVFETTDPEHVFSCFLFGVFEGWWLGEADGRVFGPLITRGDWEHLLQSTGFGGFEAISSDTDAKRLGLSAFTARAMDDKIQRWENPLAVPAQAQYPDLILLGGATAASISLLSAVRAVIDPFFARITVATTLDSFVTPSQASQAIVLSLSDIDGPYLRDLTAGCLHGLQEVIAATGTFLWVAPDSPAADPYLRMSKGLLRSLAFENPHAQFQHLAVRDSGAISADLVATTLMRLVHTNFGSDYCLTNYTENVEWELVLEGGVLKVPRLRSSPAMNQRWLVSRGVSRSQRVDAGLTCIEVSSTDHEQVLLAPVGSPDQTILETRELTQHTDLVCIRAHHATQTAVRIGESYLYLVLGRRDRATARAVALSIRHASKLWTPMSWCWPIPDGISAEDEAAFLSDVCSALLARHLISSTPPRSNLLVHEASEALQLVVGAFAAPKGIQVLYSTSQRQGHNPEAVFIPPRCSTQMLSRLLPARISVLASIVPDTTKTVLHLRSVLGTGSTYCGEEAFYGPSFLSQVDLGTSVLEEALSTACVFAEQRNRSGSPSTANVCLPEDIPQPVSRRHPLCIVNWVSSGSVHAHVGSASSAVYLSAQKTYLLVGMTGDLGRLICHWMITRGARSVVLASRSPRVDSLWLKEMSALGAVVTVLTMDVADYSSVALAHKHIQTHLPPVGGVMNGTLVIGDAAFADLTLADMLRVFAPKVEGTRLLDSLYGGADLDFFLLIGSLTGPRGNAFQTAYAAATEYMAGVVHQRHLRGQAASIIHPSQILGVGYMAGLDEGQRETLQRSMGPLCLSERDLQELVAEGILASRPGSVCSPEILGGFRMTDPQEYPAVEWHRNPKMWSFVAHFHQAGATTTTQTESTLREQLLTATTMQDVIEIVAHGLGEKLRRKLLLPDPSLPMTVLLTDIGVDSLIAVDLRAWFLKELEVDMPVMKLFGGSSLEALAASAAQKLEPTLIPLVQAEPLAQ